MSSDESKFNIQGCNIVTILKRLEAATSRLEDITIFQSQANQANQANQAGGQGQQAQLGGPAGSAQGRKQISGLEEKSAMVAAPEGTAGSGDDKSKSVIEYEKFIKEVVEPWRQRSEEIDEVIGEAAGVLLEAFRAQLEFLKVVNKSKKPDFADPNFLTLLKPINEKIEQINKIREAHRKSAVENFLNSVGEGAPVLGWIVSDTPTSLIPEFKDSSQFWSNRILKEYRDKDANAVMWAKDFQGLFDALKEYVRANHFKGPSWNTANGKPLAEVLASQGSSKAPLSEGGGGAAVPPPPPPPPPPLNIFDDENSESGTSSSGGMNAVFADLNKGENITSGLKKVDKSEMTHKNPALRNKEPVHKKPTLPKKPQSLSTGAAASGSTAPATTTNSSNLAAAKKPPRKELVDGTKWIIENFTESDVSGPIVIETERHHSVFIGHSHGVTIQVKGKGNAISVSETKSTSVVVDSLISGIDFIKSHKFGLQVLGSVAMVSVDKCDEGSIYLSQESVDAECQIFTSCSTSLNINVLKGDDYEELPVPEQFKHTIKGGSVVSEVVEHAG